MSPLLRLAAIALVAVGAFGCSSYDQTDFNMRTSPPVPASITNDHFTITEGISVGFIATPMDGADEMKGDFRLETGDSTILGIGRGTAERSFVVWGVSPGTTTVRVRLDGKVEAQIPATVVAQ